MEQDSSIGAVEDSTAKHLPECWCAERCPKYEGATCPCRDCLCDELRACEQRVLDTVRERVMRLPYELEYDILVDRDEVIGWIDKLREGQND